MTASIGHTWGSTAEERSLPFPCDRHLTGSHDAYHRAVDVDAPPAILFRWLCQMRVAPYSYDWIDNLGRRSPRELRDLPDPAPGQRFTSVGGRPTGRVLSVEPGVQLTGQIMGAVMYYVLVPAGSGTEEPTRLLLKVAGVYDRWTASLLSFGDLVMARRQLLNLKQLAERSARPIG